MNVIGREIALDTNVAVAALNRGSKAGSWATGFEVHCLPTPVVGELLFGAMNSGRFQENISNVELLLRSCRILPLDEAAGRLYAQVRLRLKKRGTPIPDNDVWIAAISLRFEVPLLTHDAHFSYVEGLSVVQP